MINKPDVCIYHSPCQDGFTSAWAIWKRWPDVEFLPGVYGEAPPDVAGKHVLMVDFSYKYDVLVAMTFSAKRVVILDHHKTAQADLERLPSFRVGDAADYQGAIHQCWTNNMPEVMAAFDMEKSGAMLAWEFAHPGEPPPAIVKHVQDRDLWRFQLPNTRAIAADLFSRPYEFEEFDDFAADLERLEGLRAIVAGGEAIERKHHKDVGELLDLTLRYMVIGGHRVPVANLPYTMASDAAHVLAEGNPFGACYFDRGDGLRQFSLRSQSDGLDVSVIAAGYGGGGHARAAGFQVPLGWEGDAL